MTMTRDKIEQAVHDLVKLWDSQHVGEDDFNEEMCRIEAIFREFALAERALEPQGQALPLWRAEKSHDLARAYDENGNEIAGGYRKEVFAFVDAHNASVRAYASQLALPAGPVPENLPQAGPVSENKHDWPEDWPQENGKYLSRCHQCYVFFTGHKRRVTCKVCASPAVVQPVGLPLPKKTGKWESKRVADYNAGWNACRVQYLLAQPAVAQPVADEREASDAYFKARHPMLDTAANRNVFSAGFRAALCQPAEEGGKS